jgi:ligand-binding SRPBCC domain-containing protein
MIFRHRYQVQASLERDAEFHSRAASMAAITPPPLRVRFYKVPEVLGEGDEMDFSLGFGPLAIRWLACIEDVSPAGFSDRQLHGPFAEWVHRHHFILRNERTTEVVDEINLRLRRHPIWWLIGAAMWIGLPVLFAFRGWKTRRMLE